ncbi:membrane-associated phospholipid phosphatase [Paenibacillus sp. V4I3]|uniref:phosphatase PAP2 family protein n=1 Tax=unclassified Paenibacillus TaxID=185978 RepID=UPI00278305B4|nr:MULTISPECIES: phosphatase PAP2 family protein [unclassified Paenibacillus]MDQ0872808.1 membrane-associated phospholipid phosphatase [Paenibacillus sp. V4I3]MDQ0891273.1 membrane-associated phospholipid phosphatase [Paenibacillus sp. V4I9]
MKKTSWWSFIMACSGLLLIPLVGLIYIHLNQADGVAYSLVTDLDRQIPFMKSFVIPYLSWYGFLLVGFLYLAYKDRSMYYKTLFQFIMGLLLCYGVYAIYQTTVPRPELTGSDWLLQMVQWVYRTDQPFNCFPSTHVLTSYLMMKAYLRSTTIPWPYKIAVTSMSLLIIVSTLLVKQHVLLDIVGAVLVSEGVVYVVERFRIGLLKDSVAVNTQQRKFEGGLRR